MEKSVLRFRKFYINGIKTRANEESLSLHRWCILVPRLSKEESFLRAALFRNGYPAKFIDIHRRKNQSITQSIMVRTKPYTSDLPTRKTIFSVVFVTNSVRPWTAHTPGCKPSRPANHRGGHDRMSHSASNLVYQFTCSCSDTYIGRTYRRLS